MKANKIILLALAPILALFLLGMGNFGGQKHIKIVTKEKGWLGVSVKELDKDIFEALGLKDKRGVMITKVHEDSPADKAGLRKDDIIIEFNGREIRDYNDLSKSVRRTKPGEEVKIIVLRQGKTKEFTAKIESKKSLYTINTIPIPIKSLPFTQILISSRGKLGLKVQDLNPELSKYFGVKTGKGVLVLEVREESPAEEAGFLPGDVIIQVDGQEVKDIEELLEIMDEAKKGEKLTFEILRHQKKKVLTAKIEYRDHPSLYSPYIYHWKGKVDIDPELEMDFDIDIDLDDECLIHMPEIVIPDIEIDFRAHEKAMKALEKTLKAREIKIKKVEIKLDKINRSLSRKLKTKLIEEDIIKEHLLVEEKLRILKRKLKKLKRELKNLNRQRYIRAKRARHPAIVIAI